MIRSYFATEEEEEEEDEEDEEEDDDDDAQPHFFVKWQTPIDMRRPGKAHPASPAFLSPLLLPLPPLVSLCDRPARSPLPLLPDARENEEVDDDVAAAEEVEAEAEEKDEEEEEEDPPLVLGSPVCCDRYIQTNSSISIYKRFSSTPNTTKYTHVYVTNNSHSPIHNSLHLAYSATLSRSCAFSLLSSRTCKG